MAGGAGMMAGGAAGMAGGSMGTGGGAGCPMACMIIMTKCATCHQMTGGAGMLDLMTANPGMRLKDMKSPNVACSGKALIDSASPMASLLYTKVTATPPCGARMPIGSMLSDSEITCMQQWVANPVCP